MTAAAAAAPPHSASAAVIRVRNQSTRKPSATATTKQMPSSPRVNWLSASRASNGVDQRLVVGM